MMGRPGQIFVSSSGTAHAVCAVGGSLLTRTLLPTNREVQ